MLKRRHEIKAQVVEDERAKREAELTNFAAAMKLPFTALKSEELRLQEQLAKGTVELSQQDNGSSAGLPLAISMGAENPLEVNIMLAMMYPAAIAVCPEASPPT